MSGDDERAEVMLKLKRAYEPSSRSDGTRILVERLWPRGLSKSAVRVDAWLKDVSPSTRLRQWFSHLTVLQRAVPGGSV